MIFTTTMVLLHSATPKGFDDEVIDGKFYNFGVQAYSALKAHKTIDIKLPNSDDYNGEEYIIPYHAVMEWQVTKEEGEYTKPEDDFCKTDGGDDTTYESVVNGTYTFQQDGPSMSRYSMRTDNRFVADKIKVTVDGTTAILPLVSSDETKAQWGAIKNNLPSFDKYPAFINWVCDGNVQANIAIILPTAGEHTVDVSVPTYAKSKQCGSIS